MQTIVKTFKGLYSQYNPITLTPNGACFAADDVVGDREGVISRRRGLNLYGNALSNPPSAIFEFQKKLIVLDGTTLKYDSDNLGTWSAWAGSFTPPSGWAMRSLEANNNFYFTTDVGVGKNDAFTNDPIRAGMGEGLDVQVVLLAAGGVGWFIKDGQVGYRILFGTTDANDNEHVGTPSFRVVLTNPAIGTNDNVTLTLTLHPELKTGDFYEVYRTPMSAGENVDPADEPKLIKRVVLTGTDITNGYATFTDTYDETYFGTRLYTNSSQEGISQANDRPPMCTSIATFKGHTFFANTTEPHQLEVQLISVATLVDNTSSITITGTSALTYTFSTAENQSARKFKRFTDPLVSENIEHTAMSLCKIINRDLSAEVFAFYISGLDDPPGKLLLKKRDLNSGAFHLTCNNATTSVVFMPVIPTSGSTLISSDWIMKNGLSRSKFEMPEAVPDDNFDRVGKDNAQILGLVALTESLLIFKEDGLFRLSGETDGASGSEFSVDEVDPTVIIQGPQTLVALNSLAYGYTTQGVTKNDPNTRNIVSRPLEPDLKKVELNANFKTLARGCAYESYRKYLLLTPLATTDTYCTAIWVYDYMTECWTRWLKPVNCALVKSDTNVLYMGHAVEPYVLKERKSYSTSNVDFVDETVTCTVTAVDTTTFEQETVSRITVTFNWSETPDLGWLFEQSYFSAKVRVVEELTATSFRLTLNKYNSHFVTGAATLSVSIPSYIEWADETAGNATTSKQFTKCFIYMENDYATQNYIGFLSDKQKVKVWSRAIVITRKRGWGSSPWGPSPWGDDYESGSTPLKINVPRSHQRCRTLKIFYKNQEAKDAFDILQMSLVARAYTDSKI